MRPETLSDFDPVSEATRLAGLYLQRYGWTKAHLNLARELIEEHASAIEGVEVLLWLEGLEAGKLTGGQ